MGEFLGRIRGEIAYTSNIIVFFVRIEINTEIFRSYGNTYILLTFQPLRFRFSQCLIYETISSATFICLAF